MHGFQTFSQMCCIMLRYKQRHVPHAHLGFKKHFSRSVLPSGPSWGFWNAEPSQHHHHRGILLSSAPLPSFIVHLPSRPAPQRPGRPANTSHIPQSDDVPVPDLDRSWTIWYWPSAESPCRDAGREERWSARQMGENGAGGSRTLHAKREGGRVPCGGLVQAVRAGGASGSRRLTR